MIEAVEGNLNISCNILQEIVYSETRKACSTYWVKFHSKYGGVDISMNTMLLIAVVVYELILIGGVAWWLTRRSAKSAGSGAGFELAGRSLPVAVVAPTMALTVLGTAHILGIFELAWGMGGTALWFGLANAVAIAIVCLTTGRWMRRLKLTTVPELLELMFGRNLRILVSCVMAGSIFGILTLETQGLGIILASMTGWSIENGAVVGGVLGVLYVIFAGMKEVGWINLFNAILMYVSLILATIYIGLGLPEGFDGVSQHFVATDQAHMLTIFGPIDLLLTFALGLFVAVNLSVPVSQFFVQVAMSAKDERTISKALWIAVPLNGLFGVFTVVLGMTAKSLPEFSALGPKIATPTMLVEMLPTWLASLLLASFLAAVLSTFAMTCLGAATIFSTDVYKRLFNNKATDAETAKVTRIAIIVLAVVAVVVASFLPPILAAIGWLLAWLIPVMWLVFSGLFWCRSNLAAGLTIGAAWGANMLWTFTTLTQALDAAQLPNAYIVLAVTLVVGLSTNVVFRNSAPGYFRSGDYAARMANT